MASDEWPLARDGFVQATRWFTRCVPAGSGHWSDLALGEWTVRDLVGHASRAMSTVEAYIDKPASSVQVASPVEYFRLALDARSDPAAIAQRGAAIAERGRDAGAALGEDPAGAVGEICERVLAGLHGEDGRRLLTTPVGGMRLVDYLPTRTFELTVHTCDLAMALGAPLDVPEAAAAETLKVLAGLASRSDLVGPFLLAATGRQQLPPGFSVL